MDNSKKPNWERDTIPVDIIKHADDNHVTVSIDFHPLVNGVIVSAPNEEEAKFKAAKMMQVMLSYHQSELKKLRRRCIWESSFGGNTWYFRILGIGLSFYLKPKDLPSPSKRYRKASKKSIWIGRLRITFLNLWKVYNSQ